MRAHASCPAFDAPAGMVLEFRVPYPKPYLVLNPKPIVIKVMVVNQRIKTCWNCRGAGASLPLTLACGAPVGLYTERPGWRRRARAVLVQVRGCVESVAGGMHTRLRCTLGSGQR